jgi:transposase
VNDVLGKSGRAMLHAMAAGTTDPATLAGMAQGRLRAKHAELMEALRGRLNDHQQKMLRMQLDHVRSLDQLIDALDAEVTVRLDPFQKELERLDTIPGVSQRTAEVLLAEVGTDMTRFPSAAHLSSWVGICPGNNESAGKRRSGRMRKGNRTLRRTLAEAGWGAAKTKNTYLSVAYRRIKARRGGKKAALAIGRKILEIAYVVLRDGVEYRDLGVTYYDERKKDAVVRNAIKRIEQLGYKVAVQPVA